MISFSIAIYEIVFSILTLWILIYEEVQEQFYQTHLDIFHMWICGRIKHRSPFFYLTNESTNSSVPYRHKVIIFHT